MWKNEETTLLLSVWADSEIQKQLMSAMRNIRVYEKIAKVLADNGFTRTPQQCRDKIKKLRVHYKNIKGSNNRKGNSRKTFLYYEQMDSVLGSRPVNELNEGLFNSSISTCVENATMKQHGTEQDNWRHSQSPEHPQMTARTPRCQDQQEGAGSSSSWLCGTPTAANRGRKRKSGVERELINYLRESDERYFKLQEKKLELARERHRNEMQEKCEDREANRQNDTLLIGVLSSLATSLGQNLDNAKIESSPKEQRSAIVALVKQLQEDLKSEHQQAMDTLKKMHDEKIALMSSFLDVLEQHTE
ncbi:ZSC32 protein, partial [Polyodon spathula]|nr:ZSC32 protein [Polyodon spathula]